MEANSIQAQPIAKLLKGQGWYTIGLCEEKYSYGYFSRYFDEKRLTCSCAKNAEEYLNLLCEILRETKVDVIIPMSDDSAVFIAKHQDCLRKLTSFSVPDLDVFMLGYDKNLLMTACKNLGVDHPKTVDLSKERDFTGLRYPAIIKPNITTGGRGMKIVKDEQELTNSVDAIISQYGPSHVQEFVPSGGRQLKVQLLVDKCQQLLCSSVMWKKRMYPVNGGSSCCNVTIVDDALVESCYKVLKHIGWRGFADFDIIEDPRDGTLKIMEINPRIPACIKSSIKAGVNWAEAIVCEALNMPVASMKYRQGIVLRYLGFDILWFVKSKERFKAEPNWFGFFGKNVCYEDLDCSDVLSFIMGTWGNIKKLANPQFRAAKSGMNMKSKKEKVLPDVMGGVNS